MLVLVYLLVDAPIGVELSILLAMVMEESFSYWQE